MDTSTIDFYNQNAASYAAETLHADMHASRQRFLAHLSAGASVLDAGCGSGRDALAFKEAGFAVAAFDASEEMCWVNAIAGK
jgi:ubiquinone/menaquinone biosynthesis C-methylase UbiE